MPKIEDLGMKKRVYEYVKNLILTLQLRPGDKIPESQIAIDLQVSKTPVREAVRLLSWEGLIEIYPNHSATVTVVNEATVQELLLVRWQHDELAVPLAIYNGSVKDFIELREIAEACIAANNAGDLLKRHELDSKFHLKIVQIGKNKILQSLYNRIALVIQFWQALEITSPEMMKDGLQQHIQIVDCLEARDAMGALHILHEHTQRSYNAQLDPALSELLKDVLNWQEFEGVTI